MKTALTITPIILIIPPVIYEQPPFHHLHLQTVNSENFSQLSQIFEFYITNSQIAKSAPFLFTFTPSKVSMCAASIRILNAYRIAFIYWLYFTMNAWDCVNLLHNEMIECIKWVKNYSVDWFDGWWAIFQSIEWFFSLIWSGFWGLILWRTWKLRDLIGIFQALKLGRIGSISYKLAVYCLVSKPAECKLKLECLVSEHTCRPVSFEWFLKYLSSILCFYSRGSRKQYLSCHFQVWVIWSFDNRP